MSTGAEHILGPALDLAGLDFSSWRDAYVAALYPLDVPAQARQMAQAQESCGLTCEAILRRAGVDGTCRMQGRVQDWLQVPYAARIGTAVAYQEQLARERGCWVPASLDAVPPLGAMVTVLAPSHVLTIVGERADGTYDTVEGGQIDRGNSGRCTAIRRVHRELYEHNGQLWLRSVGASSGRQVRGWVRAADLPRVQQHAPPAPHEPDESVPPTQPTGCPYDLTRVDGYQAALSRLGYMPATGVDNIHGPKTAAAVRRFQVERGLVADGIVGPKTRAALVEALAR